jgi:guanylate kinase
MEDEDERGLCVVVVGPCAAGKTTLVSNLSPKGYNIRPCVQEHSFVPQLWREFCGAEVLIFLDAELSTIARRQNRMDWTQARLDEQRRRLAHARAHCDFYLRTDELTRCQVAEAVEAFLRECGVVPDRGASSGH